MTIVLTLRHAIIFAAIVVAVIGGDLAVTWYRTKKAQFDAVLDEVHL